MADHPVRGMSLPRDDRNLSVPPTAARGPFVGLAVRIGLGAALATATAALGWHLLVGLETGRTDLLPGILVSIAFVSALTGLTTGALVHRLVTVRARALRAFVQERIDLARLPETGDDELAEIASGINRLLADMVELRVDRIDQERALAEVREALRRNEERGAKTGELEAQLAQRALLLEVLRLSTLASPIDTTLADLVKLVGETLDLRELAIFFREAEDLKQGEPFVLRAAWGFREPSKVLGRSIAVGEGLLGEASVGGRAIFVPDVKAETNYRAFWDQVPREGSFAVFPIHHREVLIGMLAFTQASPVRPDASMMSFLKALSAQIGLVLHHAVLLDTLRNLSTHDELTGLGNRRLLMMRLERELERARRYRHPLSVLCIDIDHFKKLNDRCGHPTGDEALRALARLMESTVRKIDTLARVGGEEFVVVLPRADILEAASVAEKLRRLVASNLLPGGEGQPEGRLTVSVGVAQLNPGESTPALLTRGDLALYAAKDAGRNRVAIYAESGPEPYEGAG